MDNLSNKLTPSLLKVKDWLESEMPFLLHLFDFEDMCGIPDRVDEFFDEASPSEIIMAKFALSVWCHDSVYYQINLIAAAETLEKDHMKTVTDWMNAPFWPDDSL